MKKHLIAFFIAAACSATFAQSDTGVSIRSSLTTSAYVKAASRDAAGQVLLTPGEVTIGVVVARLANGSCVENRSELVSMDSKTSHGVIVQVPRVRAEIKPVTCP